MASFAQAGSLSTRWRKSCTSSTSLVSRRLRRKTALTLRPTKTQSGGSRL